MKKRVFCLLLCLLMAGCAAAPASPAPTGEIVFTDDLGQELRLEKPERVVAMIGSFADIWCLAGGAETLVATASDAWTSFDLELAERVENIGAVKDPSLETILAVKPDLILASCNTAANLELRETFQQAGIPAAYFEVSTFEDYLRMLKCCTELTGCSEQYEKNGAEIQAQVDAAIARQDGSAPRALYVRASGSGCKVKGSEGNVLGEMLADLGCVNIADGSSLLEDLSLEAILAADPDYIFAVLQSADPAEAQATLEQTLLQNPAWQSLRAVQEGRFYTLDQRLYNLKPNDRWGDAYEQLAELLYP